MKPLPRLHVASCHVWKVEAGSISTTKPLCHYAVSAGVKVGVCAAPVSNSPVISVVIDET